MSTRKRKRPAATNLGDSAYEQIRGDIVLCVLEPGAEVTETKLAQRYRLGKAPIRAALQRLAQDGLVRALPRRGHLIAPITLKDIHELFELRLLVEPATAAKAATRIGDAELATLKELLQEDITIGTTYNPANTEFHLMLAELAGNHRVRETISQLLHQLERVANLRLAPDIQQRSAGEHERIIDALAKRDPAAAEHAMAEHIEEGLRQILDAIHSSEGFLSFEIGRS